MDTFRKEERLNSKILINQLFEQGAYITIFPFRCVWMEADLASDHLVQMAISVSKKKFKRAVDRNKVKRLIREAYRKNKGVLTEELNRQQKKCILLFIYTGNTIVLYPEFESKIILTLQRLIKEMEARVMAGKVSGENDTT